MGNKNTLVENEDEVQEKIIAELEARQNQAIKKLLHLRDTLNNASGTIVVGTGRSVITGQLTESVQVVIHADPANPPLSLLFLTKLLRDSYGCGSVTLKSHRHSSCHEQLSKSAQLLSQQSSEETVSQNSVDISVIWKKVPDREAQLVVVPTVQAPIRGEANVARYLSGLLPPGHPVNYDFLSWSDVIRVDDSLERAVEGPLDPSELEKQLPTHNPCLIGKASIADFVNFSVVATAILNKPGKRQNLKRSSSSSPCTSPDTGNAAIRPGSSKRFPAAVSTLQKRKTSLRDFSGQAASMINQQIVDSDVSHADKFSCQRNVPRKSVPENSKPSSPSSPSYLLEAGKTVFRSGTSQPFPATVWTLHGEAIEEDIIRIASDRVANMQNFMHYVVSEAATVRPKFPQPPLTKHMDVAIVRTKPTLRDKFTLDFCVDQVTFVLKRTSERETRKSYTVRCNGNLAQFFHNSLAIWDVLLIYGGTIFCRGKDKCEMIWDLTNEKVQGPVSIMWLINTVKEKQNTGGTEEPR